MDRSDGTDRPLDADSHDSRIVSVRPFGYVDPEPVAARVGDHPAFLGNAQAGECPPDSFDAVVSLTEEPRAETTHHRPLVDGREATYERFVAAVETTRVRLAAGDRTLVHCRAGVSRSSAVLAAALAVLDGRPFRETLRVVQTARPVAVPHPRLHELGVIYTAAVDGPI